MRCSRLGLGLPAAGRESIISPTQTGSRQQGSGAESRGTRVRTARRRLARPPGSCERGGAHAGTRWRAAAVSVAVALDAVVPAEPWAPRIPGPGTAAAGPPSAACWGGRRRLASYGPPEPGGDHVREVPSDLHDRARHQRCPARRGERPSSGDGSGTRGAGMEAAAGGAAGRGEDPAAVRRRPR